MPLTKLEPVDRRPTASIVADSIRARIVDGTFEPGLQLTEAQLAEQLGVSRGPLREAFQRLIQEGLLEAEPHRGVFVARLGPEDAADVARARAAVEREAAVHLADHPDDATLRSLQALLERMDAAATARRWTAVANADLRFHETLVSGAGSPRLSRMYATLLAETRLCLRTLADHYAEPGDLVEEHRALLEALRAGDRDAAVARIDAHLGGSPRPD